jgi:hypothetical protein
MLTPKQIQRAQRMMVIIAAGLLFLFFGIYQPLSSKARNLDTPLLDVWGSLAKKKISDGTGSELNLDRINLNLEKTKKTVVSLKKSSQTVSERLALAPEVRAKLSEPFQFVDFQIEQQSRIEALDFLARDNNVALGSNVFAHFPEYTADQAQPNLLWAQLDFLDHLLGCAIRSRVTSIETVDLPPVASHHLPESMEPFLYEVPIRIKATGSMESISKFLASLPVRDSEAKAMNIPVPPATKPPLFIHRFILKKSSRERPDEVHLELRACGFLYRD